MTKPFLTAPFLKRVSVVPEARDPAAFPFDTLSFLRDPEFGLDFPTPIVFLVGENGSGKSTLLEAIAAMAGFGAEGGDRNHAAFTGGRDAERPLARALRPAWLPRVSNGFFFRSESFFNLAEYLDDVGSVDRSGGRELHRQSHGESFLAVFTHRFDPTERNILILDEPETALSPTRQLQFLALLRQWDRSGNVQAIIATHSPILLTYPWATLYSLDGPRIERVDARDTDHFRVTKAFLADPGTFLADIFGEDLPD